MIVITSDIHHASLKTGNQQHCHISEVQTAQLFLKLLEKYNLKATFFVTGRVIKEEWPDVKPLTDSPLIELGGHTYHCFEPQLLHRCWNKLTGNYNGPYHYQKWDVQKTIDIIAAKTGKRIRSWRNHMYMHGQNTEQILAECGIDICSDGVKRMGLPERHPSGILNFPINIIPDHEHLYHAERTREWVAQWQKRYNWSDDFGSDSYDIEEWTELVISGLKENISQGRVSNVILHPITMYLCDQFKATERIFEFIAHYPTLWMSDIVKDVSNQEHLEPKYTMEKVAL